MTNQHPSYLACPICQQKRRATELLAGQLIREPVVAEIQREHPEWTIKESICLSCLNRYRADHVRRLLEEEKGELTTLEHDVIESLREQESISDNVNLQYEQQLKFGERLSDRLAQFGGSWTFITIFAAMLLGWVALNTIVLLRQPFDPYPFIFLNLILSCLAAIQAPVIMMSQNRQETRDRIEAEHDYRVNLKAELEIRLLHAKVDQLLTHQWQRLLEIQQLQMDLMQDLSNRGMAQPPSKPANP
jgi:uncharacterized membrane protein